ncbi:MAG: hypothetical protein ACR2KB_03030 [Chitinophagaceae bacterium]
MDFCYEKLEKKAMIINNKKFGRFFKVVKLNLQLNNQGNSLKPLIPFLPFLVIVIGLLKTITFYSYFGININDFISLSEVTVLFADSISLIFFLLILPFIILIANLPYQHGYPFDNNAIENRAKNLRKRWYKSLPTIISIFLFILCMVGIFLGNYLVRTQFIIIIFVLLAIVILRELYYNYYEKNKKHYDPIYFTLTVGLLMFVGTVIYMQLAKADSVKRGRYNGTKIYTSDSTYVADSSNIYVGKTDRYLFIFNTNDNSPTIIPISEVKKLTLVRRKRY